MNYKKICTKYPNRFVVACAGKRSKKTGFVSSWKVLNVQSILERAIELQEYYKSEGLAGVVIIDTDSKLPPNKVAEFFRVYYGME